jgi:hypothetical protein
MRFLRRFFIRLSNFTAGRRADQRHYTQLRMTFGTGR